MRLKENEETVCLFLYNPHYNVEALQFTSSVHVPFSNTFFWYTAKIAIYSINIWKEKCGEERKR